MKHGRVIRVFGGPQDGIEGIRLEEPLPEFWVHAEANGESVYERRIGPIVLRSYDAVPYDFKEMRYPEEVSEMKKFGTGKILPEDEAEPKTASEQQDWDQTDEKALADEVQED